MGTVLQGLILLGFVQAKQTADAAAESTDVKRLFFILGLITTFAFLAWVVFINARRHFCPAFGARLFLYCEPGDPYNQFGNKSVTGLEPAELKELGRCWGERDSGVVCC